MNLSVVREGWGLDTAASSQKRTWARIDWSTSTGRASYILFAADSSTRGEMPPPDGFLVQAARFAGTSIVIGGTVYETITDSASGYGAEEGTRGEAKAEIS